MVTSGNNNFAQYAIELRIDLPGNFFYQNNRNINLHVKICAGVNQTEINVIMYP